MEQTVHSSIRSMFYRLSSTFLSSKRGVSFFFLSTFLSFPLLVSLAGKGRECVFGCTVWENQYADRVVRDIRRKV